MLPGLDDGQTKLNIEKNTEIVAQKLSILKYIIFSLKITMTGGKT